MYFSFAPAYSFIGENVTMHKKRFFPVLLLIIGALLILATIAYFAYNAIKASQIRKNNEVLLDKLNTLIPDPHPGVIEEGRDTMMPVLSVEGVDYIGIITIPAYEIEIPVASKWDEEKNKGILTKYYGSLSAHSLILGADNALGLFGFSGQITKDDNVFFTDTKGTVYTYSVDDVRRVKKITLDDISYDGLTIFIRSRSSSDYVVVYCK